MRAGGSRGLGGSLSSRWLICAQGLRSEVQEPWLSLSPEWKKQAAGGDFALIGDSAKY